MSRPEILLVENDGRSARSIVAAFDRRLLPRPAHVTSGEDAVLWLRANPCDVCLLSYVLPGIDGLETFARIRQRLPTLPVIMLSGKESEHVAVEAFRSGVTDYVPRKPGYEEVAAERIQQIVRRDGATRSITAPQSSENVPGGLMEPSYQNKLRVIGRQLDLYNYQAISVMEVGGGILVRATYPGNQAPEALEFLDADSPQLFRSAIAARGEGERPRARTELLPTGYEDFLRAVGYDLDLQKAAAVSITELDAFFAVSAIAALDQHGQTAIGPMQLLLYNDEITFLLDEAYRRRGPQAKEKASTFARFMSRR